MNEFRNLPMVPLRPARPLHLHEGLGKTPLSEDQGQLSFVPGMLGYTPLGPVNFNLPGLFTPPSNDPQDPMGLRRPPSQNKNGGPAGNLMFFDPIRAELGYLVKSAVEDIISINRILRFNNSSGADAGVLQVLDWPSAWADVVFATADPGGGIPWLSDT